MYYKSTFGTAGYVYFPALVDKSKTYSLSESGIYSLTLSLHALASGYCQEGDVACTCYNSIVELYHNRRPGYGRGINVIFYGHE